MENNISVKKRINYIDALRGFTMLLVVYAHVAHFSFGVTSDNSVISALFRTFRMPMFFFISGYIAYRIESYWNIDTFKKIMKKKVVIQIVPASLFFCVYHYCQGTSVNVLCNGWGGVLVYNSPF